MCERVFIILFKLLSINSKKYTIMKLALLVLCDIDTLENLGRMSNALMMAKEALENDDELKFIFSGAGTKWIAELENEEHPLHKIYMEVKPYITGACEYCTAGFKQGLHVKEAGIPLISEYKKHPSVRRLIMEGYSVITI